MLLFLTCLLLLSGCASARSDPTIVQVEADPPLIPTLNELIQASKFIVVGKVDKVKPSRMDKYNFHAITESQVKVDEVLKGPVDKGDTLLVEQLGGTVNNVKYEFGRVVHLQSGHKYLLFLDQSEGGTIAPTAYLQSQYEQRGQQEMIFLGGGQHQEPFTLESLRERIKNL
jgi:hypothetical protein